LYDSKIKETNMTLRFAILGAGRIGQVHARAVAGTPGARLIAIADPVAAAAESVQAAYGCDIRTIDAILTSADVDAVVICTPTDTHADLIEKFTGAGKAVFCEKPVDLTPTLWPSRPRLMQALWAMLK
jgi:myo-inositol 2-dehydrogenase/D-chiro-inositol 1-dehydrogenase